MQSTIFFIICALLIILSVQARSIDKIESDNENSMSEDSTDEYYSKLLKYLKTRKTNYDNNDSPSSSTEDIKQLHKRGFFLIPNRRSSQRYRPIYSYGRKSHWDTFFG